MNFKIKHIAGIILSVFFLSAGLSGCAYFVRTHRPVEKPVNAAYVFRKTVLKELRENYLKFVGMSGRLVIKMQGKHFSFEQAGLYKYTKDKCIKFNILDIYGDTLFYAKLTKDGQNKKVIYYYPQIKKYKTIDIEKKYTGKKLMYKRLFNAFIIFLNLNSLKKIENSTVFYNIRGGYFFEYEKSPFDYYIFVNRRFFISKIIKVKNKKMIEVVRFKNYISKGKSKIPLKIFVDDYLYNVKIEVSLSKNSKVFGIN